LVRGDPHRTATAATSRAALTLALPTPGNNLSPRASAAIKTPCAERGHTTHSSHPPSPLQVLFVLKTLLLSVLVPTQPTKSKPCEKTWSKPVSCSCPSSSTKTGTLSTVASVPKFALSLASTGTSRPNSSTDSPRTRKRLCG